MTVSANELCSGEDIIQEMGSYGFSSMGISGKVYSQKELESLSKELAISWKRPVIEIKLRHSMIREYSLSNQEIVLERLKKSEQNRLPKTSFDESEFTRAMDNRINVIIYEYDTTEEAELALKLLGNSSEYHARTGKYYIFSKRNRFKVEGLKKYISFCTKPLHQIFRKSAILEHISLPNGWGKYNINQPETSDIDTQKARLKLKKESPLIQTLLKYDPDTDKVRDLIQNGTELNGKTIATKRTALHLVLLLEDTRTIDTLVPLLIEEGIDCNTQDSYGITPLMLAAQHSLKLTQDLISCGADSQLKNKPGKQAINYAKDANMKDVVEYLSMFQ